ncbi:hypothetical protein P691DRAFT_798585 [Macrolepiota fuliginosa MF-IS2]|uniref:BHLH domain-containing protein n=1 Tax=Macrolepiota fuliginosa MF-IS2 TaxID=1400762 RepID=A0A9P6BY17_9AGAR|nr:hypothetical protein P691DRAFT_798585 [Macrolepiota fuliginosa MF-IS2]
MSESPPDPLSLIIHMDDDSASPPDWSQLGHLWADQQDTKPQPTSDYLDMDFSMDALASNILDFESLSSTPGIEPSALHLDRLGYPSFDDVHVHNASGSDPFGFPASASPADILAAQFPFTFGSNGDIVMDPAMSGGLGVALGLGTGVETPGMKQRRLSITSSSSSSGPSFSPVPESLPSPGGSGYLSSDSTQQVSEASLDQAPTTTLTTAIPTPKSEFPADPAAELAQRVRQSAGVMLAVPMNGTSSNSGSAPFHAKLPIPRLQRPSSTPTSKSSPISSSPSVPSSAASTPPPSTPPSSTSISNNDISPTPAVAIAPTPLTIPTNGGPRPKTSHTTIERRYRTNLNARIQSLRMAVPALRVLEDRDSASSKKIKKNVKGGVLIKSSSSAVFGAGAGASNGVGGSLIAVPNDPANPYYYSGEVDVIDERGYVDGVKVARKCSKANVLGKAVEYIRVLKRREMRLRAEQAGLKTLVCGLVGGPALLREWEKEWRERFGGEEKDEVEGGEGDIEDEGEEDDDDDAAEDDDDDTGSGKKRKRAKVDKDPAPKKEPKSAQVTLNADGQPEKRKRGRPRKVPLPVPAPAPAPEQQQQQPQQQQQYLLAVFALFSFFNNPLASSPSPSHTHAAHQGHVISPAPLPLAYAPEVLSQLSLPAPSTSVVTWRDWVQVAHLVVTPILSVSAFGHSRNSERNLLRKMRKIICIVFDVCSGDVPRHPTSHFSRCQGSIFVRYRFCVIARALWSPSTLSKKENVVLRTPIDEVFASLSLIKCKGEGELVDSIAELVVKRELGVVLGKIFVKEVNGGVVAEEQQVGDLDLVLGAAYELGGEVGLLARKVESVRVPPSADTKKALIIGWSSSPMTPLSEEEDEETSDGSSSSSGSSSSLEASIMSDDDTVVLDDQGMEEEEGVVNPYMILRALVLYRSLFSSATPSSSALLSTLAPPPPTISVEPPTPTTPTPPSRRDLQRGAGVAVASAAAAVQRRDGEMEQQKQMMYALRRVLGSRVFEGKDDEHEVEDARDRVVDMLVEAERKCVRVR